VLYFWHSVGNGFLTLVSNMFTDLNLTDMETCYKMARTDLMQSLPLKTDRFGIEPELTARLAQARARIYEVPISYTAAPTPRARRSTGRTASPRSGTSSAATCSTAKAPRVVDDQHGAPTSTLSLAVMMMGLLEHDAPPRIWHATDSGRTTWYGFAGAALELAGIDADITPCNTADFPTPARRPSWSVLDCSRTYALLGEAPEWRDALAAALQAGVGGE
jgi:hypothetical protein